jgi:hypothetical protein
VRVGRPVVLLAAVVVTSAAVASGVTYLLVAHDSVAHKQALPPIALTGVLRDTAGKPVPNAWVQLTAADTSHPKVGVPIPEHPLAGAYTDATGRFTIRQPQSVPIIRKLARENWGTVNFDLDIRKGRGGSRTRSARRPPPRSSGSSTGRSSRARPDRCPTMTVAMADENEKPLSEQLEEIGAQLDWVRGYL